MPSTLTLLRIDASARTTRSLTRRLADHFIDEWQARRPLDRVLERDVGFAAPPLLNEDWISAAFTPAAERTREQRARLALSDRLINELRRADLLLLATPMYNYGMPAALKAWVDQVIRVDETFSFDRSRGDWPLEPTLEGKALVLLTSSGEFGFEQGGVRSHMDHLTPHLATCAPFLGVNSLHRVGVEYQEFADGRHRRSLARAYAEVSRLADRLASRSDDARSDDQITIESTSPR